MATDKEEGMTRCLTCNIVFPGATADAALDRHQADHREPLHVAALHDEAFAALVGPECSYSRNDRRCLCGERGES